MPELMTRAPGIESPWPPFLGPTVRVDDDPGDVPEERFYDWGVEEEGIWDATGDHEMEDGNDSRGG